MRTRVVWVCLRTLVSASWVTRKEGGLNNGRYAQVPQRLPAGDLPAFGLKVFDFEPDRGRQAEVIEGGRRLAMIRRASETVRWASPVTWSSWFLASGERGRW